MSQARLNRRGVLSGGLAVASTCMVSGRAGAVSPMEDAAADLPGVELVEISECEIFGPSAAEAAACHAPFRAAFLAWLGEASGRLALPFSVDTAEPFCTELHVPGLHPALEIRLDKATDINVYVQWRGVWWDILASMDVYATPAPDGSGWRDTLLIPEAQRLHLTQEACWQEEGFEWLLRWLNDDLATATHLALWGGGQLLPRRRLDSGAFGPRRPSPALGKASCEQQQASGAAAAAHAGNVAGPKRPLMSRHDHGLWLSSTKEQAPWLGCLMIPVRPILTQ